LSVKIGSGTLRLLGVFALAALSLAALPARAAVEEETLPSPAMTGHFSLHTPDGRMVTDASFHGKWLLVYFGYTNCPDVCPTVLNEIGVALHELGPLAAKVQPVFVTVDPARDKPPVLKKYLSAFDPRILGLRGNGEETEAAAKAFHVYYRPVSLGNAQYTMDHSGYLYLIDPKGKFVQLITGNLPGHDMAKTLRKQVK
jgi:protein SCO1/2